MQALEEAVAAGEDPTEAAKHAVADAEHKAEEYADAAAHEADVEAAEAAETAAPAAAPAAGVVSPRCPRPWLVVGLGNPGPGVRGHPAQCRLPSSSTCWPTQLRHPARPPQAGARAGRRGQARRAGSMTHVVLAEPLSFMNESGGPVKALMAFYGVEPDRLVVVHDELDIPFAPSG